MNKKRLLPLFVLPLFCLSSCEKKFSYKPGKYEIADTLEQVSNKKAHVVFLYGQSNADGVSSCDYLASINKAKYDEYKTGYENVYINYFNDGGIHTSNYAFVKHTLGCGCFENYFGPEAGIAESLSKTYPEEMSFIIKWTWGGTSLNEQWLNGKYKRGDLYKAAMEFSKKSLNYLKGKGYSLSLDGICWMQGESDAGGRSVKRYYKNTKHFVKYLRNDFKGYQSSIKFVDAFIDNEPGNIWEKPGKINETKLKFSEECDLNYCIDTVALGLTTLNEPTGNPDKAHYDSQSMVTLGLEFGKVVTQNE